MNRTTTSALGLILALSAGAAAAQELRIGLRDDPGSLDPATNASFVGRVSLQSVCDKLFDIDSEGNLIPMLVESWEWSDDLLQATLHLRQGVVFHDGTPFDAEAVAYNINRFKTLDGSRRAAELKTVERVEVVDDHTAILFMSEPNVAILTQMTDRAGMMVSPAAAEAVTPEAFANAPVCAGPYVLEAYNPQESVILKKFPDYWNADAFHFEKVVFAAIPDSSVRLLNLRSGDLDLIEDVPPNDVPSIESDAALAVAYVEQPAYEMVQFNLDGPGANPDVARHVEVREAFSLAIDREAINQVVFGGRFAPTNQPFPPSSPWYNQDLPVQPRDVEAAKARLASVGLQSVTIDLLLSQSPQRQAVAEMMQAMLAEAGIILNVLPTEFISMRDQTARGDFQAYIVGSSGRVDPDLNISLSLSCGTANNVGKYCNPELDEILSRARAIADPAARKPLYDEAIAISLRDLPAIYTYSPRSVHAFTSRLKGYKTYPDAIIRLQDVSLSD